MKEKLVCSSCGKELTNENLIEFDGLTFCADCLENQTTTCDCCGERIWRDENSGDANTILCERCYEYNYTHCERCGRAKKEKSFVLYIDWFCGLDYRWNVC